ncbi:protein arginine N-methyltransferase 1 [Polistes fuscatus]|uniref:protein arginine N-methyltransferase 1 n=1 Tax=Polistes fuscatus TaxID=30207 RepID=UPI001CA92399|nr:protein arginine N-methyltransferase 1 [Polistes fuscatus]
MTEQEVMPVIEMDETSDADSGDDWSETNEDTQTVTCLFCKDTTDGITNALKHLEVLHNFALSNFITKHSLDSYSYIKLINFIRQKNIQPEQLNTLCIKDWQDDEYLYPVIEDDPLLMYDVEDLENKPVNTISYTVNSENGCVTLSEAHFAELQRTIQTLKAQLEQREIACFLAKQQVNEMVEKAQKLVLDDEQENIEEIIETKRNSHADDGYFNTYSHFAIHHEMLTDSIRTKSYRDALFSNSTRFNNCIMLDVGCGTGILSMFAAISGCRKVISVDQSDVIYQAMDIIRENNLDNVITLKKGRLEDISLGEEKVDAIISEWMGYFLLFEGMLDTVIYARDHYLVANGVLMPNRCSMSIVGSGDTQRYVDLIDYWSNVYGFKMSCMKSEVLKEPSIEICRSEYIITTAAEIQTFDLYTVTTDCVNFSAPFNLTVKKTGSLTAIIGYFDVFFDLETAINFSTGPNASPTHWKQTVFSLKEPISITEGEVLSGKLICRRHIKDVRGLIITIHIKDFSQVYYMN